MNKCRWHDVKVFEIEMFYCWYLHFSTSVLMSGPVSIVIPVIHFGVRLYWYINGYMTVLDLILETQ